MISRENIQQLFEKMQAAGWDMDQKLAWGYFFKHQTIEPLEILAKELEQNGYEIIDINQSYPDKRYWLQLEKIEQHSIDSLHQTNQKFYQLAKQRHIDQYDGMDVSPVDF